MAQQRARRLVRRFGGGARIAALAALVVLLAGVSVAGVVLAGTGGVAIERSSDRGAEEEEAVSAGETTVSEGGASEEAEAADEAPVVVHVDGAVVAPGVYELSSGSRVADAVSAAGGLAEGADTTTLNLAAPLADGEKIHVPQEGDDEAASAAQPGVPTTSDPVVNLNTASVEELDTLPGIGEATARAIVEDREKNGPYTVPEDLMRVSGIGEKKFAKLEGLIRV